MPNHHVHMDKNLEAKAKESKKLNHESITTLVPQKLYDEVLEGIVRNVKMGPFQATSGIELACKLYRSIP